MQSTIVLPNLAPNEFLGIFVVATLVLVFGVGYAGLVTLAKMGYVKRAWQYVAYLFWLLQVYVLYDLSLRIHSSVFTQKILIVAMIAYLFAPHLYFYLVDQSAKRYESALENRKEES